MRKESSDVWLLIGEITLSAGRNKAPRSIKKTCMEKPNNIETTGGNV